MFDKTFARQLVEQVLEAVRRIEVRSQSITAADDFHGSEENLEHLDSISMMLITIGENIKKFDKMTEGTILWQYPQVPWPGVKGVRDVLAHDYFNIDAEEIFSICKNDVPVLKVTLLKIDEGLR